MAPTRARQLLTALARGPFSEDQKRAGRGLLSDLVALVGLGLITHGCFLLSTALGWIVLGAGLVVVSVINVLPPTKRPPSAPKGLA